MVKIYMADQLCHKMSAIYSFDWWKIKPWIYYIVAILSCFLHIQYTRVLIIALHLKSFELCVVEYAYLFFFFTLKVVLSLPLGLHNYIILQKRMPIFHDVFVKLMIIYFFQDQCIAKLESLGFRIGQSLVERYFSIYIFKIIS